MAMVGKEILDPDFICWKKIPGIDERYEASFEGKIRRRYKNGKIKVLSQFTKTSSRKSSNKKTKFVKVINSDGKRVERQVHRMVYEAFHGPVEKGVRLVHKNGIQYDNSLPNIIPMDAEQIGKRFGGMAKAKTILKIDREGNVIDFFTSTRDVERKDFISRQTVSDRLNYRVKKPFELNGYTYVWDDKVNVKRAERFYKIKIDYVF